MSKGSPDHIETQSGKRVNQTQSDASVVSGSFQKAKSALLQTSFEVFTQSARPEVSLAASKLELTRDNVTKWD
ncbi:hypothetical protein M514_08857 [Trichuris suis]|uniref:Uncharacterized protein n=1 Tax=Trichuris suis TaxID=68888 RepID=A0A085MSX1_9BILA|nr:hypothetical protein M513_08857 [Trichuris suis]KFD60317.1 hypothetical protein M514_08857 [Trichuris suis]